MKKKLINLKVGNLLQLICWVLHLIFYLDVNLFNHPPTEQNNPDIVKLSAENDVIVEDEVFEGVSELKQDEIEGDIDTKKGPCKEQKQQAMKMLSELKNVISSRADDMKEREKRAILRKNPEAEIEDNNENFKESISEKIDKTQVSNSVFVPPSFNDMESSTGNLTKLLAAQATHIAQSQRNVQNDVFGDSTDSELEDS